MRRISFLIFLTTISPAFCAAAAAATARPAIKHISPTSTTVGTQITIIGTHFGAKEGAVTIGGASAKIISWKGKKIVATVPSDATTGSVVVSVPSHTESLFSNEVDFTVTPVLAHLSPATGPEFTWVTIDGSGFGASPGSSTVSFSGVRANLISWSSTGIEVLVPVDASSASVTVTVGGIVSNELTFAVTDPIASGPIVTVSYPLDGALISDSTLILKGSVTLGVTALKSVRCNSVPAKFVGSDFTCTLTLDSGRNGILVLASDYGGQLIRVRISVTANFPLPPPRTLEITPSFLNMDVGETNQFEVRDELFRVRMDAAWTLSNTTTGKLSSGSYPVFTAIAEGSVVLTARVGLVSTGAPIGVYSGKK